MAYNTIKIRRYNNVQDEYEAHVAITPGALLTLNSDNEVLPNQTVGGDPMWMFALEDELQGKGINDNYVAGDRVQVGVFIRGEIVYALLDDEVEIAIGDYLEPGITPGKLREHVSGPIVGIALEAKVLSTLPEGSESSAGGEYYNPRIPVMIL